MNKRFARRVEEARKSDLQEELDYSGYMDATPKTAIDMDWLGVIAQGNADLVAAQRLTAAKYEALQKKRTRRALALLIAAAIEWERRL